AGAGIVFFAYIGFDAVSTAAQEAKNPQRDMPIGIIGSLLICTVLYILVSGIATGVVPYRELNVPDPIAVAADRAGLGWMSTLITFGAIAGLSSVILGMLLGRPRVFRTPAVGAVAPLGALSALYLMVSLSGRTWARLGIWFVIGMVVYFVYGVRHSRLAGVSGPTRPSGPPPPPPSGGPMGTART